MNSFPEPFLIEFSKLGAPEIGYISVTEQGKQVVPFDVKRIFWTYYTPESIVRGRHAHRLTEQVLIAVAGSIIVTVETVDAALQSFRLDRPNLGLYVPPHVWHTMQYSHTAVQLVLASTLYNETDYLREKDQFVNFWGGNGAPISGS